MENPNDEERYGYEGEMTPLKCDELKVYVAPTPDGTGLADYCLKSDVDEAIAELKDVIHELQVDLEGAKATAYADSVDAGMRERRLRRALWLILADLHNNKGFEYLIKANSCAPQSSTSRAYMRMHDRKAICEKRCRAKAEEYR